jgi:tryptophan-rich sensory protein
MPAWLSILLVMVIVGIALNPSTAEFSWFLRLRRPAWLTFERWIPLIWLVIYTCFYGSALLAWRADGSSGLMAGYLLLLVLVQSYTLVICKTRKLSSGTAIGLLGWLWGLVLAGAVQGVDHQAAQLLIPYLLWSPIGTLVTWQMQRINR